MLVIASLTVCKLVLVSCQISKVESTTKDAIVPGQCQKGTYYSRDYMMCMPCSTCDYYSTVLTACTASSDTVCIKCTDTSQPDIVNHPACKQCPPCEEGEYLERKCSQSTPTVCRPCPKGSFNRLSSYRPYCTPCTSCTNKIMITDCNSSVDTECGPCKKGYFRDPHRNQCSRCVKCLPGQLVVEECQNGLPDKLCSESVFYRTEYIEIPNKDSPNTSTYQQADASATDQVDTSTTHQVFTSTVNIFASSSTKYHSNKTYFSNNADFLNISTNSSSDVLSPTSPFTNVDIAVLVLVILLILMLSTVITCFVSRLRLSGQRLDISDECNAILYYDNAITDDQQPTITTGDPASCLDSYTDKINCGELNQVEININDKFTSVSYQQRQQWKSQMERSLINNLI